MRPAKKRNRNRAAVLAKILRQKLDPEKVKILNMPLLAAITNATT